MAYLLQQFEGKEIGRWELGSEPLLFGRSVAASIFIEDIAVSRQHCQVEKNDTGYVVTDLDSQNGTFVNGKQVVQARLKNGDEIALGKYTIVFMDETDARQEGSDSGSRMLLTPPHHAENTDRRNWYLTVLAKNFEQTIMLQKTDYLVGKHRDCEIELTGWRVEPFHAIIAREPNQLILINVADRRPTLLNTQPAGRKSILMENDIVKIGGYELKVFSRE